MERKETLANKFYPNQQVQIEHKNRGKLTGCIIKQSSTWIEFKTNKGCERLLLYKGFINKLHYPKK